VSGVQKTAALGQLAVSLASTQQQQQGQGGNQSGHGFEALFNGIRQWLGFLEQGWISLGPQASSNPARCRYGQDHGFAFGVTRFFPISSPFFHF
jgi:hypothetical protein